VLNGVTFYPKKEKGPCCKTYTGLSTSSIREQMKRAIMERKDEREREKRIGNIWQVISLALEVRY